MERCSSDYHCASPQHYWCKLSPYWSFLQQCLRPETVFQVLSRSKSVDNHSGDQAWTHQWREYWSAVRLSSWHIYGSILDVFFFDHASEVHVQQVRQYRPLCLNILYTVCLDKIVPVDAVRSDDYQLPCIATVVPSCPYGQITTLSFLSRSWSPSSGSSGYIFGL